MTFSRNLHARVFIQEDEGGTLWKKVAESLAGGDQAWISSCLLHRVTEACGKAANGGRWLVLSSGTGNQRLRRAMVCLRDVSLSLVTLLLLSPLLVLIAALVKLTSPGPVFYSTVVVGLHRQQFRWLKFRSMRVQAQSEEEVQGRVERFRDYAEGNQRTTVAAMPTKVINRAQVTAVGRIIRRYSIDELPQLWHVLCGQMSLVGPRPCLPYEAEHFNGWRERRFDVLPGLTGVWQVFGRGVAKFEEAAAMDVFYTYTQSGSFDWYLIWKTVGAVLGAKGAM